MSEPADDSPTPFGDWAHAYIRAGWAGVIPLPLGKKWPPYDGYTGEKGQWPSGADIQAWLDGPEAAGNIALRLPVNVIGIDVDTYADKHGDITIREAAVRYGGLPPTWRTTSRADTLASGIYLYRIADETLRWPGQLGQHVEIIQHRHRYAVAPPSLHPEGAAYRWIDPHGNTAIAPPRVDDLPYLPDAWVTGITAGQLHSDTPKTTMDAGQATPWLIDAMGEATDAPCGVVDYAYDAAEREMRAGSRHDAITRGTLRLVRLATEGHPGTHRALGWLRVAFIKAVTADKSRDERAAATEWTRALVSACNVVKARPSDGHGVGDPCDIASLIVTRPAPAQDAPAAPASAQQQVETASWDGLLPPGHPGLAQNATDGGETPPDSPSARAENPEQDQLLHARIDETDPRFLEQLAKEMLRRQVRARVDEQDAARTFREPPYHGTGRAELAVVDPPIAWAVERLLPADGNALLVAQRKTGKTTLVNALMKAMTEGTPFVGRFAVAPLEGRVGIFNYEVSGAMYRTWLREADLANPDGFAVWHLRGYSMPLLAPNVQDRMVRWLVDNEVTTWIVDPYARAYLGTVANENSNSEVGLFLELLDNVKERAGVKQIIMPAHTGKGIEEGKENARGAARVEDWADAIWTMTMEEDGSRYLGAIGRDVDLPEEKLTWHPTTRQFVYGGGDRRWEKKRKLQNVIIEVVRETPGIGVVALRQGVHDRLKSRNTDIDDTLAGLVSRHELTRQDGPGRASHIHLANPRDGQ